MEIILLIVACGCVVLFLQHPQRIFEKPPKP